MMAAPGIRSTIRGSLEAQLILVVQPVGQPNKQENSTTIGWT